MTKASKNDTVDNKPDYSLLPKVLMDQLAYVMMAGAQKYGRYNYTKGHNLNQLISAAERHLKLLQSGEDIDADTSGRINQQIHHAACVCANMLMLLHQRELGTLVDDRFKPELTKTADIIPVAKNMDEYLTKTEQVQVEVPVTRGYFGGGSITGNEVKLIAKRDLEQFLADNPRAKVIREGTSSYFIGGNI